MPFMEAARPTTSGRSVAINCNCEFVEMTLVKLIFSFMGYFLRVGGTYCRVFIVAYLVKIMNTPADLAVLSVVNIPTNKFNRSDSSTTSTVREQASSTAREETPAAFCRLRFCRRVSA